MNLPYKIIRITSAMWFDMQLTAGYVTTPILSRLLPKIWARKIVGILFAITALCDSVIFGVAYVFFGKQLASFSWWILVLWLPLACNHLLVIPIIGTHKYGLGNWLLSLVGGTLGVWHGLSNIILSICTILATVCVWKWPKLN